MQITPEVLLYPFRSAKWKEVFLIGGALGLVGTLSFLIPPAALVLILFPAFGLRAMRQAIRGDDPVLPTWNDFGKLINDALWFVIVFLFYSLPSFLIAGVAIMFFMMTFFLAPTALIGSGQSSGDVFGLIFFSGWAIYMLGIIVSSLLALPLQFLAFIGLTRAVAHDNLRYAFEVQTVWRIMRGNFLNFAVSFATVYAVYLAVGFVATISIYTLICSPLYYPLLGIGLMYASLVGSVMFGLAYRHAQSRFAMAGIIA